MNSLSIHKKKQLRGNAKKIQGVITKRKNIQALALNMGNGPHTGFNALQVWRLSNMYDSATIRLQTLRRKFDQLYPAFRGMSISNIISNVNRGIQRHERVLRNIHSGRRETGR